MSTSTNTYTISGMTCTSCEVIIERKLKKLEGVTNVDVSHANGTCTVTTNKGTKMSKEVIEEALQDTEYRLAKRAEQTNPWNWKHLLKIGGVLLVVYLIAKQFGLLTLDPAIDENMSYGSIFFLGLVASVSSCMAVVGGLVLTFTATTKRLNPMASKWELLRAHVFFNGGRLIGYFLLGGLVAVIGAALPPSPRIMGVIGLLAALVMVLLALDLLGLSGSKKWIPRMPKRVSHWIHDMAEREEWWVPFVLGALTFFLPCGFTQSMQLYALTAGGFMEGALTLFVFALGTLPALFGIGAVASALSTKGKVYKWFMIVSGSIVLLLGVYNIGNSLNLLGVDTSSWFEDRSTQESGAVVAPIQNGKQVVQMSVYGIEYLPAVITIQKDIPVEWQIDGAGATGCTSVIAVPSLGISKTLNRGGITTVEFTPKKAGRLPFTCGMGMASGTFIVVD